MINNEPFGNIFVAEKQQSAVKVFEWNPNLTHASNLEYCFAPIWSQSNPDFVYYSILKVRKYGGKSFKLFWISGSLSVIVNK